SGLSPPPILAALLAAPVTAHDPHSEPDQRPEEGGGQRQEPQRPGETPEQEVEADVLGVLEHEDEQQAHAGQRGDGASPEPTCLGLRAAVTGTLTHDHSPLLVKSPPPATLRHPDHPVASTGSDPPRSRSTESG